MLPRICSILCLSLSLVITINFSPSIHAQNGQIPAVDQIDTQAERLQDTQSTLAELEERLAGFEKDLVELESSTLDLTLEKNQLEAEIKELEIIIQGNEDIEFDRESNQADIIQKNSRIKEIQVILDSNDAKKTAVIENINELQGQVDTKQSDLKNEVSTLSTQLTELVSRVGVYFILILTYWVLLRFTNIVLRQSVPQGRMRSVIRGVLTGVTIIATCITILFAFIGNLNLLITGVGLLSAALVVALQDFVSSFFAWILISIRGQYRVGDVVTIDTGNREIYGHVIDIGFLRTTMKEKLGGKDLNREQTTGRTLIFPNNIVLKHALRNNNLDNRLIWNNFDVTITFESDCQKAFSLIQEVVKEEFEHMVDHKDMFLDDVFNLKSAYTPKVFLDIASSGPKITIWFPSQSGKLREVLSQYSRQVLAALNKHGIELAYDTYRIIESPTGLGKEAKTLRLPPQKA